MIRAHLARALQPFPAPIRVADEAPGGFYLRAGAVTVLGLSSRARGGKDFMADSVAMPLGFLPIPLANPLKIDALVRGVCPLPEVWEEEKSEATRENLQRLGTELGRNQGDVDVWCKMAEALIYYYATKGILRFVVPDVRFPNEVALVQRLGGKVIRLTGRGGLTGATAGHASELALGALERAPLRVDGDPAGVGFDAIIDNSPERSRIAMREVNTFVLGMVRAEGDGAGGPGKISAEAHF
jgi:hypothetical protein